MKEVRVSIELPADQRLGSEVEADLVTGFKRVAEDAMIEQLAGDLSVIREKSEEIRLTIEDILRLVLQKRGISLAKITLEPAEVTTIRASLRITVDQVFEFKVRAVIADRPPFWPGFLRYYEESFEKALNEKLAGLPYAAPDPNWSRSLVQNTIKTLVKETPDLGGFIPLTEVILDKETNVLLTLVQKEGVRILRDVSVKVRSFSLPSVLLSDYKQIAFAALEPFRGISLTFFTGNQPRIIDYITERFNTLDAQSRLEITPTFVTTLSTTDIYTLLIAAESNIYRINLNAELDLNRVQENPRLSGWAGLVFPISTRTRLSGLNDSPVETTGKPPQVKETKSIVTFELFLLLDLFPADLTVNPQPGIGIHPSKKSFVGVAYDMERKTFRAKSQVQVLRDLRLSFDYHQDDVFRDLDRLQATYFISDNLGVSIITNLHNEIFTGLVGYL